MQPAEDRRRAINGEAHELCHPYVAEIGAGAAGKPLGITHRQVVVHQALAYLGLEHGAQLLPLGVWQSQISKHVAGAAFQRKIIPFFDHVSASFSRLTRSRTTPWDAIRGNRCEAN
jgi:hypothetical protein